MGSIPERGKRGGQGFGPRTQTTPKGGSRRNPRKSVGRVGTAHQNHGWKGIAEIGRGVAPKNP